MLDVEARPGVRAIDAKPLDDEMHQIEAPLLHSFELSRVGGEALAWGGVLLVGALLRLVSLGGGALSAEGARHAYAALALFRGSETGWTPRRAAHSPSSSIRSSSSSSA